MIGGGEKVVNDITVMQSYTFTSTKYGLTQYDYTVGRDTGRYSKEGSVRM